MHRKWVVNASLLITLAKVGKISLLYDLCEEMIIPSGTERQKYMFTIFYVCSHAAGFAHFDFLVVAGCKLNDRLQPRSARPDAPGTFHHAMGRGIEGTKIFRNKAPDIFISIHCEPESLRILLMPLVHIPGQVIQPF